MLLLQESLYVYSLIMLCGVPGIFFLADYGLVVLVDWRGSVLPGFAPWRHLAPELCWFAGLIALKQDVQKPSVFQ